MVLWWLSSQNSHLNLCKGQWWLHFKHSESNNRQNQKWTSNLMFAKRSKLQTWNSKHSNQLCQIILRVQRKQKNYTPKSVRNTSFPKSTGSPFWTCAKFPLIKYSSCPAWICLLEYFPDLWDYGLSVWLSRWLIQNLSVIVFCIHNLCWFLGFEQLLLFLSGDFEYRKTLITTCCCFYGLLIAVSNMSKCLPWGKRQTQTCFSPFWTSAE